MPAPSSFRPTGDPIPDFGGGQPGLATPNVSSGVNTRNSLGEIGNAITQAAQSVLRTGETLAGAKERDQQTRQLAQDQDDASRIERIQVALEQQDYDSALREVSPKSLQQLPRNSRIKFNESRKRIINSSEQQASANYKNSLRLSVTEARQTGDTEAAIGEITEVENAIGDFTDAQVREEMTTLVASSKLAIARVQSDNDQRELAGYVYDFRNSILPEISSLARSDVILQRVSDLMESGERTLHEASLSALYSELDSQLVQFFDDDEAIKNLLELPEVRNSMVKEAQGITNRIVDQQNALLRQNVEQSNNEYKRTVSLGVVEDQLSLQDGYTAIQNVIGPVPVAEYHSMVAEAFADSVTNATHNSSPDQMANLVRWYKGNRDSITDPAIQNDLDVAVSSGMSVLGTQIHRTAMQFQASLPDPAAGQRYWATVQTNGKTAAENEIIAQALELGHIDSDTTVDSVEQLPALIDDPVWSNFYTSQAELAAQERERWGVNEGGFEWSDGFSRALQGIAGPDTINEMLSHNPWDMLHTNENPHEDSVRLESLLQQSAELIAHVPQSAEASALIVDVANELNGQPTSENYEPIQNPDGSVNRDSSTHRKLGFMWGQTNGLVAAANRIQNNHAEAFITSIEQSVYSNDPATISYALGSLAGAGDHSDYLLARTTEFTTPEASFLIREMLDQFDPAATDFALPQGEALVQMRDDIINRFNNRIDPVAGRIHENILNTQTAEWSEAFYKSTGLDSASSPLVPQEIVFQIVNAAAKYGGDLNVTKPKELKTLINLVKTEAGFEFIQDPATGMISIVDIPQYSMLPVGAGSNLIEQFENGMRSMFLVPTANQFLADSYGVDPEENSGATIAKLIDPSLESLEGITLYPIINPDNLNEGYGWQVGFTRGDEFRPTALLDSNDEPVYFDIREFSPYLKVYQAGQMQREAKQLRKDGFDMVTMDLPGHRVPDHVNSHIRRAEYLEGQAQSLLDQAKEELGEE